MPDFTKAPPAERLPAATPETKEQIESFPLERGPEIKPGGVSQAGVDTVAPAAVSPAAPPRVIPELQQEVERVLEDNLADIFRELTPAQQIQFKAKGEAVAAQITKLLQQVKFKVSQILRLIREWLRSIPGINRYFVEQEAKIKADRIIKLH